MLLISVQLHSLYTYLAEDAAKEIAILESNSGAAAATGINDIDTILDVLKALTDVCRIRQSLITL